MIDKETLPPDLKKLVKQGKFTYLLLKIAFENKSKLLKNKEKNSQRTKRKKNSCNSWWWAGITNQQVEMMNSI